MDKIKLFAGVMKEVKNRGNYFREYLGLANSKSVIYETKSGLKFKIRVGTSDRGCFNDIILRKCYERHGFEIGPNDIVFDIGAQTGIFSVVAAQKAKVVYAFEPMPDNCLVARENLAANNIKNVRLFPMALSNKNGKKNINVASNTSGHSFYFSDKFPKHYNGKLNVPVKTLDSAIEMLKVKRVDLLKLDVEGSEYDILYNCKKLSLIKKMVIEYHNVDDAEKNRDALINFLRSKGFIVSVEMLFGNVFYGMLYAKRGA